MQVTKELETAKRTNLAIVDQAMLVETEVSAAKDEVRSLAPRFAAGAWGCGCARARAAPRTRLIAPAAAWISTSLRCSVCCRRGRSRRSCASGSRGWRRSCTRQTLSCPSWRQKSRGQAPRPRPALTTNGARCMPALLATDWCCVGLEPCWLVRRRCLSHCLMSPSVALRHDRTGAVLPPCAVPKASGHAAARPMRQHGEARGCAQLIADSDAASAAKTDPARPSALAELPSKQPSQKPTPAGSRRPSVAQCPRCAYPGLDARPAPVDEDNEDLLKRLDAVAARERAVAQASAALAQRSAAEFATEHQVPCERDAHMATQGRPVATCSGCI
jgi:hypothetical protein